MHFKCKNGLSTVNGSVHLYARLREHTQTHTNTFTFRNLYRQSNDTTTLKMVLSVYTQFAQIARIITFQVEKKQKWFWSDRPERVASKESSSGFANAKNARTDTEIET